MSWKKTEHFKETEFGSMKTGETITHEEPCPRCGDMFYPPKTVIEDARQHAKEWEETHRASSAENETLQNCVEILSKDFAKAELQRLEVAAELSEARQLYYEVVEQRNKLCAANVALVEALKKHIEKYCPKSTNQSACTWMHDYQDLKQALAKHGGKP